MITLTATPDYIGLARKAKNEYLRAFVDGGWKIVDTNIANVRARLKPDGTPQKANSPGYAAWKRKKFGHDIPLVAKERLFLNRGFHEVIWDEGAGGRGNLRVFARVPLMRRDVLEYLRNMGAIPLGRYEHWGMTKEAMTFFRSRMHEAQARIKRAR